MSSNSYNSSKGYTFDRPPEMRRKPVPYSRFWIGILSVVFTAVVGAFMLADSYILLEDRRKALILRITFLGGILLWWFLLMSVSLLISPASDSIVVSVATTLLAWFAPLPALYIEYRRWQHEWVKVNDEIVKGKGAGSGFFYGFMMIVVTFLYHAIVPPIAASAILGTAYYYEASAIALVDGSFSMSYPEYWAKSRDTSNPACRDINFECVENFRLPSNALLSIARINKDLAMPLAIVEEVIWDSLSSEGEKDSIRVFETTLDGFEAIQRDFSIEVDGLDVNGIILVSMTDTELYVIVGAGDKPNFYQIEDAIATIQLDAVSNSE